MRLTGLLASLGPLVIALPAIVGCIEPTVVRVIDGQPIEGRYISENAYLLYALAADAEARGDFGGALEAYEAAELYDPDSPEIWTRIGALRCKLAGKIGSSDDAFARAQALDPGYEPLYREWASCAAAGAQLQTALRLASRAVELDPQRDATTILYASILEKLGRLDEAKRHLDALTVWHPLSVEAWSARYGLAQRQADHAGAAHAAGQLRLLAPSVADRIEKDIPARAPLAEVDLALQEGDLARARRNAISARLPPAELALRAAALGQPMLAREQAELVLGADPESSSARVALAVAADLTRDDPALRRALDLPLAGPVAPLSPIARLLFAELLGRRVGREACLVWLGPLGPPAEGRDPLLRALHSRVAARLRK